MYMSFIPRRLIKLMLLTVYGSDLSKTCSPIFLLIWWLKKKLWWLYIKRKKIHRCRLKSKFLFFFLYYQKAIKKLYYKHWLMYFSCSYFSFKFRASGRMLSIFLPRCRWWGWKLTLKVLTHKYKLNFLYTFTAVVKLTW